MPIHDIGDANETNEFTVLDANGTVLFVTSCTSCCLNQCD